MSFLTDNAPPPKPAEPERAQRELDMWRQNAAARSSDEPDLAKFMTEFAACEEGRLFLEAIFGNSPFLSQGLRHNPALLQKTANQGFDQAFEDLLKTLVGEKLWQRGRPEVMSGLRLAKRSAALAIALADIAGAWPLEKVCQSLSRFAEISISIALNFLLCQAAKNGQMSLANPENPESGCGIVVLGMGKLGANELNYSSDIDLLVLFDGEVVDYAGDDGPQQGLHRMVRELVVIMGERSADGYVFRTDMRLRPDPSATPLAVSTAAAEHYYESLGQNWERAAMIKARAVAGDQAVGEQFLSRLVPFVWRKYLDFAAIEDIHSIKRQINAHKGHHEIAVAGHDIKVGRGGIREIEFYAQTQQLIWGGKEAGLRQRATCQALQALVEAGHADAGVVSDLVAAYGYLRRLEHRLQMVADEQTHLLPKEADELAAIACFMGYDDVEDLSRDVKFHLSRVETHYADLFEDSPELAGTGGNLVFTGTEDDPDTLQTLRSLGFSDGHAVSATVRGWHHGRIRATRSPRARELLTELMPGLLGAFSQTVSPDAAFRRFDEFLSNLPAGVQLFSMFYARPGLLDSLAEIMGSAPSLAEHLSRHPTLLDGVLTGRFYEPVGEVGELTENLGDSLAQAADFQDLLDAARRWTHDREFQIGMQLLRGMISGEDAGVALSDVAEANLNCLLPHVEEEFCRAHGTMPGGEFIIVGLGKLGGREMTFSSDLDVLFIYRGSEPDQSQSDGPRALPLSQYYGRLSQRLVTALSALTPEGKLYEIDARLRPSGAASPLASEVTGFADYQDKSAWNWEHMALTRARVIAGAPALAADVRAIILNVLTRQRDKKQLVCDVADMRERIDKERFTENVWKLKHVRGGLLDLEFIAQYFQLREAYKYPEIIAAETDKVFERLAACGVIEREAALDMAKACRLLRRLQALLRLTVGVSREENQYPAGVRLALAEAARVETFDQVKALLMATEEKVRGYYAVFISQPAQAIKDEEEMEKM
ncbi:MAG: bifunctional [glutamine synthetase] adenylyltransferase/[glutamine synthetase]-adenylyl-L-tyrosine phosphorylase [Rhodospirillaceae bacterium]|nr:bifunctional [glutamine synthetase] adenylyltransferase/[glutamine synthetase]-adenylyl-L-tyrosine phosphorylase [Rhodospirillaceae bacterium]